MPYVNLGHVVGEKGDRGPASLSSDSIFALYVDEQGQLVAEYPQGGTDPSTYLSVESGQLVYTYGAAEPDPVLANNDWDVIRAVCEAGNASAYWSLGDTKHDVGTDFVPRMMRICDMQGLYGKHVVFEQVGQEATTAVWNQSSNRDDDSHYNNYNISNMRTTVLPALLANYSASLSGQITNTTYKVAKNGNSSTILDLTDKLFLPAEKEIFGSQQYCRTEEADALTWFALYQANNTTTFRIKYRSGSAAVWWERSPESGYANNVCAVGDGGSAGSGSAYISFGVSPCFAF